ncbi:hypothetical protein CORMATOL_01130 [Corynebacterium matruchotii ATCC 33806]|uniref:Uncharacterized protein n=1 Tax=Corynebacterium matruchotii ATCC 33806 TaxID=566549 RepID=C0E2C4_9CORY|nr:hypothetical protein CORMATOL_01130 [Corynebacterium matruchotii ATCC 33806]
MPTGMATFKSRPAEFLGLGIWGGVFFIVLHVYRGLALVPCGGDHHEQGGFLAKNPQDYVLIPGDHSCNNYAAIMR